MKEQKKNKKKFIDIEASETSEEESDDDHKGEISKHKQKEMYTKEMLKRRNQKNILQDIEEKYKDGGEVAIDDIKSDEEIELPGIKDPKVF